MHSPPTLTGVVDLGGKGRVEYRTYYEAINLCGRRWTLEIMTALQAQPMRFTDLIQHIRPTPSSKSLNDALRRLQDQNLIFRPGGTEGGLYQLTPAGQHLIPLLEDFIADLQQWSQTYRTGWHPADVETVSRTKVS